MLLKLDQSVSTCAWEIHDNGTVKWKNTMNGKCSPSIDIKLILYVWAGYDSDVAREKNMDYTTKIYAISIREMSGVKPHQQQKEILVDER